jgi:uncharacterized protein YndB with AHSA1/START domain
VFAAISSQVGLSRWWTTTVEADERVGGTVAFTFGGDFNPRMQITRLERPSTLAWECQGGYEPWASNTFRFQLADRDGGGTSPLFRQEYAQELSDVQYGTYNFNWAYYLESLRRYCDLGEGVPHQTAEVQLTTPRPPPHQDERRV